VADDFLDAADAVVIIMLGAEDVVIFVGLGIGGERSDEAAQAVVGEVLDEGAEDGLAVEGRGRSSTWTWIGGRYCAAAGLSNFRPPCSCTHPIVAEVDSRLPTAGA
jgi:hypothetical protein